MPEIFSVLDFETTGHVAGFPNEPWQVGIVSLGPGGIVPGSAFSAFFRISPDRPFSRRAPGRWASIRDVLASSPEPYAIWDALSARLCGVPLVAHNASTERTVLRSLAPVSRFGPWIDTLPLARRLYPGMKSYALGDLVAALGLQGEVDAASGGGEWHDALYDAFAAAVLLDFMRRTRPGCLSSGLF